MALFHKCGLLCVYVRVAKVSGVYFGFMPVYCSYNYYTLSFVYLSYCWSILLLDFSYVERASTLCIRHLVWIPWYQELLVGDMALCFCCWFDLTIIGFGKLAAKLWLSDMVFKDVTFELCNLLCYIFVHIVAAKPLSAHFSLQKIERLCRTLYDRTPPSVPMIGHTFFSSIIFGQELV